MRRNTDDEENASRGGRNDHRLYCRLDRSQTVTDLIVSQGLFRAYVVEWKHQESKTSPTSIVGGLRRVCAAASTVQSTAVFNRDASDRSMYSDDTGSHWLG